MADSASRSVPQKLGIVQGMRAYLRGVPDDARRALDSAQLRVVSRLAGSFDYMHCFVTTQEELDALLPRLKSHLDMSGMLWVSWPKGRKLGTDLALPDVIRIACAHGLVESVALSINETWSALKLTYPKAGKRYNNKYGTLPDDAPRRPGSTPSST